MDAPELAVRMKSYNLLLLLLAAILPAVCLGLPLVEYTLENGAKCYHLASNEGSRRCFTLGARKSDWHSAVLACEAVTGRQPAVVEDAQTHRALVEIMTRYNLKVVWIPARLERNSWFWAGKNENVLGVYSYWRSERPVKPAVSDIKDCVMAITYLGFVWEAKECAFYTGYICQADLGSKLCDTGLNLFHEVHYVNNKCLLISNQRVNFFQARNNCTVLGAELLRIENQTVQNALQRVTTWNATSTAGYWIGLTQTRWLWYNSEEVKLSFWEASQPSSSAADCIMLKRFATDSYFWANFDCSAQKDYICSAEIPKSTTTSTSSASSTLSTTSTFSTKTPSLILSIFSSTITPPSLIRTSPTQTDTTLNSGRSKAPPATTQTVAQVTTPVSSTPLVTETSTRSTPKLASSVTSSLLHSTSTETLYTTATIAVVSTSQTTTTLTSTTSKTSTLSSSTPTTIQQTKSGKTTSPSSTKSQTTTLPTSIPQLSTSSTTLPIPIVSTSILSSTATITTTSPSTTTLLQTTATPLPTTIKPKSSTTTTSVRTTKQTTMPITKSTSQTTSMLNTTKPPPEYFPEHLTMMIAPKTSKPFPKVETITPPALGPAGQTPPDVKPSETLLVTDNLRTTTTDSIFVVSMQTTASFEPNLGHTSKDDSTTVIAVAISLSLVAFICMILCGVVMYRRWKVRRRSRTKLKAKLRPGSPHLSNSQTHDHLGCPRYIAPSKFYEYLRN